MSKKDRDAALAALDEKEGVRACCNCAGDHVTTGCGRFVPRCQSFPLDDATMQCELPKDHPPLDGVVMHRGGTVRYYDPATGRGPAAVSNWTWSDDGLFEGSGQNAEGALIAAARAFVAAYDALDATDFYTTRQHHIIAFDEALARLRIALHPTVAPGGEDDSTYRAFLAGVEYAAGAEGCDARAGFAALEYVADARQARTTCE